MLPRVFQFSNMFEVFGSHGAPGAQDLQHIGELENTKEQNTLFDIIWKPKQPFDNVKYCNICLDFPIILHIWEIWADVCRFGWAWVTDNWFLWEWTSRPWYTQIESFFSVWRFLKPGASQIFQLVEIIWKSTQTLEKLLIFLIFA